MKKALNIFLVVLITTLCIFYTNLISTAYAQETKLTPIMGTSQATQEQAVQILKVRNRIDNDNPKTDKYIEDFVEITWEEATDEGVRADIAFSLMMLETNFLKSKYVDQNNFGGLGVFEGGAPASFDNVRLGIRAVVQHIKAYASTAPLVNECIDPRFEFVTRGSAVYLEWLGQKENPQGYGWATANGHGYRILNILNQMCGNPLTPFIYEISATQSGSTYSISTKSLNATGALYKFIAINTATGQQTLIQNYSQKSTATWTPSSSGSYKIKAYIKRASSPYEYDAYTTCNVTPTTVIKSFNIEGTSFFTGGSYKLSASATSANKPLYKFFVRDSKLNWTVLKDYSETNSVTWKPTKPDQYLLVVHVKDSNSSNTYDTYTSRSVTVKNATIESFTVGNGSDFYHGKSYTVSAKAYSANKPLYKFWVRDDSDFSWTVIKDYSEVNTATWTPTKPGKYLLVVHVKDSNSSNSYDTYTSISVTVKETPTVIQLFDIGGTSFFTGGSYQLSANATSANKPLYKFFVRDSNFNWTVLQDYSETNSVTWKPTKPDQYLLVVHVKDSNSSNTYDTYTSRSVTVKDTTIESFTVGNGSGFHPGKSYTVSAKAYSANKPLYKFWVRDDSDFSWTVIKDYSEVNTATWTPTKSGTYLLVVHVKDSNSSNSYDTFASRSVTVRPEITIVLDAGHGGSDPGAVSQSTGLKESDLNLEQTLILGNLLKAYGFNVIYTRDTNKYLSLEERVDIANNINADLFISIHHDSAYPNTSVKGISTHYSTYRPLLDNEGLYEEYSSTWGGYITLDSTPCDAAVKSKILAERIASGLASLGFNNRGTHDHNLYVTKWTTMPSVLIEVGFMSNPTFRTFKAFTI